VTSHDSTEIGVADIAGDSTPDWATLDREIVCPLCAYNLRGLSEARCPECGHRSSWYALLQQPEGPAWLFENADNRRVRALVHTWTLSLFPVQFWRRVHPRDEPRMEYLFLFSKVIVFAMILITFTPSFLNFVFEIWRYALAASPPPRTGWSPALYNALVPRLTPILSFQDGYGPVLFRTMLAMIAWPWLTALTLLIFQQTLRSAQIRAGHVVRVAVYSGSVGLILFIPFSYWVAQIRVNKPWSIGLESAFVVPVLLLGSVMTYRLWVAYRLYMRLPSALFIVCASQIIVALFVLIALTAAF
jgi:hypothetical protein